jgi:hypothetical protein
VGMRSAQHITENLDPLLLLFNLTEDLYTVLTVTTSFIFIASNTLATEPR